MKKIIRATTIPLTLNAFCRGLLAELKADYDVVALSSPGEELDDLAQHDGVRTIAIPMARHIAPWKDLRSLCRLIIAFVKEKPDMVHSMTPKAGLLCMMAARIAGVPLRVHTFSGLVFPAAKGMKRRLLILTDRMTCACATHIIPEGEGVRSDLRHYGITKKPLRVLGYGNVRGIDLKYYCRSKEVTEEAVRIRQTLGIPEDAFVFVFVGRLVADKGINTLVASFIRLRLHSGKAHLLLVGREETELNSLNERTLLEMEAMRSIHKVGEKDDVRPWYAAADALVFPSYRESFPNVVLEAGAMGLPSIVTDINGSREIILNGENGVVIPPRNGRALCYAMRDFIDDPEATRRMAHNARPLIASRYEQGYVRRRLKDFYSSLFNAKGKPADKLA